MAVCGCVAQEQRRIVAEDIQQSSDPQTAFVQSCGVLAYCCHPLLAHQRVLGTLSFGLTNRARFTADEIDLMQAVADQVATAMQRLNTLQELSQVNAQHRELDRQKSQFLAVLSHELRNPLAPIVNSLYILDHAQPGGEQSRKAKQVIERQVHHLTRMVDDLLDVTRFARGQLPVEKQPLELAALLVRTAEDHRSRFDNVQIQFDVQVNPSLRLWVNGDSTRIAQAVGNLLSNAAKFTLKGGHVILALEQEGSDYAVIRVKDDGVGITDEILARLFEPFVQADETLDRKQGGLGLGLALVKGMVDLHDGLVQGTSHGPGKGAEFVIRLPLVH
jgi:signal transduction histidine kinase